ncbi:unnamed protein product [Cylindrotheca closterium]|uniref:Uncharacterized protein n=1 Tax=Cylindrotheca closterium TaxID=2856 RepID=A0AAD2CTI2_9STRA|nr:unnamed protein product [Cylindrotheca closterium]
MKITCAILPLALAWNQASAFSPSKVSSRPTTLPLRMADEFADEIPEGAVRATIPISEIVTPAAEAEAEVAKEEETPTSSPATASSASAAAKEEPAGALVAITQENIEFSAGVIGAVLGLVLGGPYLAAIAAAAANFASKSEGNVVGTVSKSGIEVYNSLLGLNAKYEVSDKAGKSLNDAVAKLKTSESVDPETFEKVEKALSQTKTKITEVNDEYDLVGAGLTALGVVGDLIEKTVKKAGELNEQYELSSKAKDALDASISKAGVSESLEQATSFLDEKKEELNDKLKEVESTSEK